MNKEILKIKIGGRRVPSRLAQTLAMEKAKDEMYSYVMESNLFINASFSLSWLSLIHI